MSTHAKTAKSYAYTAWIALRFLSFGVGGFLALFVGSISLAVSMDSTASDTLRPAYAVSLAVIGSLMMLFGSAMWKRWAYLAVFLSVPATLALITVLHRYRPKWAEYILLDGKLGGGLLLGAPMVLSYWAVKGYYKRRESVRRSSETILQIGANQEDTR